MSLRFKKSPIKLNLVITIIEIWSRVEHIFSYGFSGTGWDKSTTAIGFTNSFVKLMRTVSSMQCEM